MKKNTATLENIQSSFFRRVRFNQYCQVLCTNKVSVTWIAKGPVYVEGFLHMCNWLLAFYKAYIILVETLFSLSWNVF